MARKLTRTTSPAEEPITTAQAKLQIGLASGVTGWNDLLTIDITAARQLFEEHAEYCCVESTYTLTMDEFPSDYIQLNIRPVQSVTSIQYRDIDGNLQTWASTNYRLDAGSVQPRIVYDDNALFPVLDVRPEAITITFVAGHEDASSVPSMIKKALLIAVKDAFENRGGREPSNQQASLMCFESLTQVNSRNTYP